MRLLAALVFALVTIVPATADDEPPPADNVFRQFKLFGTWAVECGQKPSPANPYIRTSEPSPGEVIEEHDLGPMHRTNRYSVLSAERLSDTQLRLRVLLHPGAENEERQTLIYVVRYGERRTLFNQPDGGPARVKDGIVVGYGLPTPTLQKCN